MSTSINISPLKLLLYAICFDDFYFLSLCYLEDKKTRDTHVAHTLNISLSSHTTKNLIA